MASLRLNQDRNCVAMEAQLKIMEDRFIGIEEKINAQDMKLDQIMLILKKLGTKSGKEKEVYFSSATPEFGSSKPLMCKDSRVMAGAGASDFVLYKELREFAWRAQSDHREALLKFADSLLVVPAILAENNGFDVMSTIKKWHDDDNMMRMGINISTGARSSIRIWDLYTSRESAVTSALDFVLSWLESMAAKELKSYIYGGL
ncbi:unnamed protein product [Cuscuta campestris]|uniref:Uncharacterized protein n=1 Tax=Cuscuta campestris TaxID=132261 RepID=A0A484LBY3_9ASTE|nr:unnamed protein product [Cuscuta campestris]